MCFAVSTYTMAGALPGTRFLSDLLCSLTKQRQGSRFLRADELTDRGRANLEYAVNTYTASGLVGCWLRLGPGTKRTGRPWL